MHKLACLITQMHDEAGSALGYARCALRLKESDHDLAETYLSMAKAEIEHLEKLMSFGAKALSVYEAGHPDDVCTRSLYEHCEGLCLEKAAEAKLTIESCR